MNRNILIRAYRIFITGCIAVLSCQSVYAEPVIDEVVRDIELGVLTIKGSGFGDGPNVFLFDDFESDQAKTKSVIPLNSPKVGEWSKHGTYKPLYDDQSSVSGKFSALMYDSGTDNMRQFQSLFGEGIQEVFMSFWVRIPDGTHFPGMYTESPATFPKDSSWKFNWLIDQDYHGNSSDIIFPSHIGYGKFAIGGNDGIIHHLDNNEWWSWTSWNRISVWARPNKDSPTLDGELVFQVVSEEKGVFVDSQNKPVFDADGPAKKQYQQVNFPGWIRGAGGEKVQPLYDDIYIAIGDNSNAKIELSNNKNYELSNILTIQLPEIWTDTEIVIKTHEGSLGDVDSSFVFVTNKDGVRNSVGKIVVNAPEKITLEVR